MRVERCQKCGHKVYFNKDAKGKIDENRWRQLHKVDFLQISHKDFERVYGKPKVPKTRPNYEA